MARAWLKEYMRHARNPRYFNSSPTQPFRSPRSGSRSCHSLIELTELGFNKMKRCVNLREALSRIGWDILRVLGIQDVR